MSMHDPEITDLLERASTALEPDVHRIMSDVRSRGRRAIRRRRIASGLGAVAAATAVAAVAVAPLAVNGPSKGDRTTAEPALTAPAPAPHPQLADPATIKQNLLQALPSGTVTDVRLTSTQEHDGYGATIDRHTITLQLDDRLIVVEIEQWPTFDPENYPAAFADPGGAPHGCERKDDVKDDLHVRGTVADLTRANQLDRLTQGMSGACFDWNLQRSRWECSQNAQCIEATYYAPRDCTGFEVRTQCTTLSDGSIAYSYPADAVGKKNSPGTIPGSSSVNANRSGVSDEDGGQRWSVMIDAYNTSEIPADNTVVPAGQAPALTRAELVDLVESDVWFQ